MAAIQCYGDSITYGFLDPAGGWPQRLRNLLESRHPLMHGGTAYPAHVVYNLGISDETAASLGRRIEGELSLRLTANLPNILVVQVGTNDAYLQADGAAVAEPAAFVERLAQLITMVRQQAPAAYIVLCGLTPCDPDRLHASLWAQEGVVTIERLLTFDAAIRRLATRTGVSYVGLYDRFAERPEVLLSGDGLHPSAEGHQLIANAVYDTIKPWLATADRH